MFGLLLFGANPFATILSGDRIITGQVWVDQCATDTEWSDLPLENTGWNTEPVAITAWEDQKENTILTKRCN